MRLTVPKTAEGRKNEEDTDRKIVVIAGIHQYGTWIASEFIRRSVYGRNFAGSSVMFGNEDFILLVSGTFDAAHFRVTECGVHAGEAWQLVDNKWRKFEVDP